VNLFLNHAGRAQDGQRGSAIGKTMDGFALDFHYQSLAPALVCRERGSACETVEALHAQTAVM